jgi:hypothetical protein
VGFETTVPVFERSKTFHAFDRAATVIGVRGLTEVKKHFGRIDTMVTIALTRRGMFAHVILVLKSLVSEHESESGINGASCHLQTVDNSDRIWEQ